MFKTLLTAVSAAAILAAVPAIAQDESAASQTAQEGQDLGSRIEQGLGEAGDTASDAASDAAGAVTGAGGDASENVEATLIEEESAEGVSTVTINERMTATGMIGQTVYNERGDRVAQVDDIIVDQDGEAIMVILGDSDFTGLGDTVAFDYSIITQSTPDGDMIAPVTEEVIENAVNFSYDPADASDTVEVVPENGYSVSKLLKADVVDPAGETLASVDNISFRDGAADKLIVAFNQILGLGGDRAALNFENVALTGTGEEFDFQLNASQAQQFEEYKNQSSK